MNDVLVCYDYNSVILSEKFLYALSLNFIHSDIRLTYIEIRTE